MPRASGWNPTAAEANFVRRLKIRVAKLSSSEFLRGFARAYVSNTASEARVSKASIRELGPLLIEEFLDQGGGEGLIELLAAFGLDR